MSLLSPACAITIRSGATPCPVRTSSAAKPVRSCALVWTMIGAPVSTPAAAIAARIRGMSPITPCFSTAHFRNAAFTPVSSMPSLISRTNSSAIASTLR